MRLSDEQRKKIEQIIDGKPTTRPLDDGTIKASRWIHAGAAEDVAEALTELIEGWISEAVTNALESEEVVTEYGGFIAAPEPEDEPCCVDADRSLIEGHHPTVRQRTRSTGPWREVEGCPSA